MIKVNATDPVPPPAIPLGIQVVHETDHFILTDSKVGEGSFGEVSWGYSKTTGSPIVAKKVQEQWSAKSENKALKMGIPHTPRYRETFEHEQAYYIVMDQVDAVDLEKSKKSLTLGEIISIASQALEFLAHLAERNLTHNDIKPPNMIWKKAVNCLTFVDLASIRDASINDGPERTIEYAAPEVLLGGEVTTSCDVWSLACVLYELIVGEQLIYRDDGWFSDPLVCVLSQIERNFGSPSSRFLEGCKKTTDWQFMQETPDIDWKSSLKQALKKRGAKDEEIQQWNVLFSSMLCYENRASAKDLIKSRLFYREIHLNLVFDSSNKCMMQLHRASALSQQKQRPAHSDLTMDFWRDRNTCLHIPRDPQDRYILFLTNHIKELKIPLILNSGETLDITSYQNQLMPIESASKKPRTQIE